MLKKIKLKYILMLIISIIAIVFIYNNYFIYKSSIIKIINIDNVYSDDIKDESIKQNITGKIMNGNHKGYIIHFNNETSKSGVYDEQLHENSEVFAKISNDATSVSEIIGVKRDKYLIILLVLFIDLAICIGGKKGIKSLITLIINIVLSILCVYLYINNSIKLEMLLLFILLSIIFILLSLIICHGFNKKTLVAVISSILSVVISFGISYIVLECSKDSINFWNMDYIEVIRDYEGIFYVNILLSGLGAIMDIAITMSSSLNEIIAKNPKISKKDLIISGKQISKDIIGTMINVLLFTCYVSIIPIVVLATRNYISIANAINNYGQIEMIRILTSSISIIISIPIALYVSIFIYKRGEKI